jgi:hypothetical protein
VVDPENPEKPIFTCATRVEARERKEEQTRKDAKHGNKRVLQVVSHEKELTRGRDLKKLSVKWEAPEKLADTPMGELVALKTVNDVTQLGRLMGHCASDTSRGRAAVAGEHFFFTILDKDGSPLGTFHGRNADFLFKEAETAITCYDKYFNKSWSAVFSDAHPPDPPYAEWEAEQRAKHAVEWEKQKERKAEQKARYIKLYGETFVERHYGDSYFGISGIDTFEKYLRNWVGIGLDQAGYDADMKLRKTHLPLEGLRPANIEGYKVIHLSCSGRWNYEEGRDSDFTKHVKEYFEAHVDPEEPLVSADAPKDFASNHGFDDRSY